MDSQETGMFSTEAIIPKKGYRWVRGRKSYEDSNANSRGENRGSAIQSETAESWYLVPESCEETKKIQPLEKRSLHCDFAFLTDWCDDSEPKIDRKDILEFANTHGCFGEDLSEPIWVDTPNQTSSAERTMGESISVWEREIFALREALELKDAITQDEDLTQFLERRNNSYICKKHHRPDSQNPQKNINLNALSEEELEEIRSGGLKKVARFHLQTLINPRIVEHVGSWLELDSKFNDFNLNLPPKNLLGAIWFQFARMVTNVSVHRPCLICGKPIPIDPDVGFQQSKKTCNDAHRKQKERKKNKANKLKKQGLTTEKIKSELSIYASLETIESWIN